MNELTRLIREDMRPALGVTEPGAIAYAVASAREQVQGEIRKVHVALNSGMYKNAYTCGIPNSSRYGSLYAAALGAVAADAGKGLQSLADITEEDDAKAAEMADAGLVEVVLDTEAIFVDGTHIKASANLKKQARKAVPKEAKRYAKELFDEVNRDREEHGKKPLPDDSDDGNDRESPKEKEVVTSTTDPESGLFHKGEHKKCFAYEAHTACDKHNFILGVHVTPGTRTGLC